MVSEEEGPRFCRRLRAARWCRMRSGTERSARWRGSAAAAVAERVWSLQFRSAAPEPTVGFTRPSQNAGSEL